jgi:hypothetical protein
MLLLCVQGVSSQGLKQEDPSHSHLARTLDQDTGARAAPVESD